MLHQTLRQLLLPVRPARENDCIKALEGFFASKEVAAENYDEWTSLELGKLIDKGNFSPDLIDAITHVLSASDPKYGPILKTKWQSIWNKLRDEHFFEFEEARAFLSHSFLIIDLRTEYLFSAAQISKLISARDNRVRFSRQTIYDFLSALKIAPVITEDQVKTLVEQDRADELGFFADANITVSAEIVSDAASRLGFPATLSDALQTLYNEKTPSKYTPYLQILHYQCCIAEYYDHALTDIYEFKPRGVAADWLAKQYPGHLAGAANPFLNNAKSVERLSGSWVRSKAKAERPGAAKLLETVSGLEAMGFSARRELARLIRLWLERVIRLSIPQQISLPKSLDQEKWQKLLDFVALENTKTFGILEQRVVDAISSFTHRESDGWRSRGVGASVNATNVSQRKIGDCDFQNATSRQVRAYEAHGGKLTSLYVEEHLRTLEKTMVSRGPELSGIADVKEWDVDLVFIAHSVSAAEVPDREIMGVKVRVKFKTYNEFFKQAIESGIPSTEFDNFVLEPLREARTPSIVRDTLVKFTLG